MAEMQIAVRRRGEAEDGSRACDLAFLSPACYTEIPMPDYLHTDADLDAALAQAGRGRSAPASRAAIMPAGRLCAAARADWPDSAAIICAQQLSTASASAIFGRLRAAFDPFHHDALRRARAARLARLGLSAAKIKTIKSIAAEIAKGRLDLDALARI